MKRLLRKLLARACCECKEPGLVVWPQKRCSFCDEGEGVADDSTATHYWAWTANSKLVPLGRHESSLSAYRKADALPDDWYRVFALQELLEFKRELQEALPCAKC